MNIKEKEKLLRKLMTEISSVISKKEYKDIMTEENGICTNLSMHGGITKRDDVTYVASKQIQFSISPEYSNEDGPDKTRPYINKKINKWEIKRTEISQKESVL